MRVRSVEVVCGGGCVRWLDLKVRSLDFKRNGLVDHEDTGVWLKLCSMLDRKHQSNFC